jgi:hypothetical protein
VIIRSGLFQPEYVGFLIAFTYSFAGEVFHHGMALLEVYNYFILGGLLK